MSLVLIIPADDYQLLSAQELRLAVGLASGDDSADATLTDLGLEAAEWIASICGVPAADGYGGSPLLGSPAIGIDTVPTFRQETVEETRQIIGWPRTITLARRFLSSVVTVILNDVEVEATDYRINRQTGVLERVVAGLYPACWGSGTFVATYTAGFATIPPAMKSVARDYVAMRYSRDSASLGLGVRSKTINDIESITYQSGGDIESALRDMAMDRLARYMTQTYS